MRVRVGLLLCLLFGLAGAVGCRKSTNTGNLNAAPETWITSAPQDTITLIGRGGAIDPASNPALTAIPVRFHLYWAGADRDGEVVGYYFAVVETTAVATGIEGIPSLPGPKARDYRFTTKTDSIFIFTTSADAPAREHAFYVYAVDNKGGVDPTPAKFTYRSIDLFPPRPVFTAAFATGRTVSITQTGPGTGFTTATIATYPLDDTVSTPGTTPPDTVPSASRLTFRWRAQPVVPNTSVVGYRYKIDEPDFVVTDTTVHEREYNTGVPGVPFDLVSPGPKLFKLQAIGQSGWRGEATRRFVLNFSPDTWYSGPDPTDPAQGWQSLGGLYAFRRVSPWPSQGVSNGFSIPNTLMGPDSINILPAYRARRRTFFEIYRDTIWARSEGDTVHLNSWVVFSGGGFDSDSPYRVGVRDGDPNLPPQLGPVLTKSDSVLGSPTGFRTRITQLTSEIRTGERTGVSPAESFVFPLFDVNGSQLNAPYINAYTAMITSGRAFGLLRAADGDGALDGRIADARALVTDVEGGTATPDEVLNRPLVLTFYVNQAPYLRTDIIGTNGFRPQPGTVYTDSLVTGATSFLLFADDPDPYNRDDPQRKVGGPLFYGGGAGKLLRRSVYLVGRDWSGAPLTTQVRVAGDSLFYSDEVTFTIPLALANGPTIARIRLCDCDLCEERPGNGMCVARDIPITLNLPGRPTPSPSGLAPAPRGPAPTTTQRPGSSASPSRSQ